MSLTQPLPDSGSDTAPLWDDVHALAALSSTSEFAPPRPAPPVPVPL